MELVLKIISIRKAKAEEKKVKTHTQVQRSGFHDSTRIKRLSHLRRGERKALLVRGGIREHEAFLGHEMRGPAGTRRGGVSMAGGWPTAGKGEGQGAGKWDGVRHRHVLFRIYLCISAFCLKKGGC